MHLDIVCYLPAPVRLLASPKHLLPGRACLQTVMEGVEKPEVLPPLARGLERKKNSVSSTALSGGGCCSVEMILVFWMPVQHERIEISWLSQGSCCISIAVGEIIVV